MTLPHLDDVPGGPDGLRILIGAVAMINLDKRGYLIPRPPDPDEPEAAPAAPATPKAAPRMYESRYVGVTKHRDRWLPQWGHGGKHKGHVQPPTPEGEEEAAWERARALGRDWLETRPPERVKGTPEATAAREARGRGRTKLAGRRIG
jgi:hypothetical protein